MVSIRFSIKIVLLFCIFALSHFTSFLSSGYYGGRHCFQVMADYFSNFRYRHFNTLAGGYPLQISG